MTIDNTNVFDEPLVWRLRAADALGLAGEALLAAASPGAGFPAVLRSLVAALPQRTTTIVDLGAGACGASEWLRQQTGAWVVAVEPQHAVLPLARDAFPELRIVEGTADNAPLRTGFADFVTLCGVVSLLDELDPALDEIVRLLGASGSVGIADLFADSSRTKVSGPNVFRTVQDVTDALVARGLEITEVGFAPARPDDRWAEIAGQIDSWIEDHCRDERGYDEWLADRRHLDEVTAAGDVLAGVIVATRRGEGDR